MAMVEFKNEALTDFSRPENRSKMEESISKIEKGFGKIYPLIIGGKEKKSRDTFKSINPSKKEEIIGLFQKGTEKDAEDAIKSAKAAFTDWKMMPSWEKAGLLFRTASVIRKKRFELSATMVLEVGKNWIEADADVAEAIDFCEFYGREAIRLAEHPDITTIPGTFNDLRYIPLGVGVVIPPWNFPLAILVGMTTAAIATGNTVVLKPASDSPLIAYKFMDALYEAGMPDGVVNLLTGPGALSGNYLVEHKDTRFISFTGSMAVGCEIYKKAAIVHNGQIWLKRVIAEMGGKDAVVVDCDTDVSYAVDAVFASAFGFQGQKCSACSRAIVDAKIYDEFISGIVEKAKKIKIGQTKYHDNYLGPVINEPSLNKTLSYVDIGKKEGKLLHGGEKGDDNGFFMTPAIFGDVPSDAKIAQEEIFAPFLSVIKVKDFDEALKAANGTIYGLTGAVLTRDAYKIRKAKKEFHVGNLYINRKCTGALVGVEPFGGFNMSGTDSKAGGKDYLLLFTQAKSISERV